MCRLLGIQTRRKEEGRPKERWTQGPGTGSPSYSLSSCPQSSPSLIYNLLLYHKHPSFGPDGRPFGSVLLRSTEGRTFLLPTGPQSLLWPQKPVLSLHSIDLIPPFRPPSTSYRYNRMQRFYLRRSLFMYAFIYSCLKKFLELRWKNEIKWFLFPSYYSTLPFVL